MDSNDWKREFSRLMELFERETIISLKEINRCFKVSGRLFDENFREYFLKMSTLKLDTSFDMVLCDDLIESRIQQSSQNFSAPISDNEIDNNSTNTSENKKLSGLKIEKKVDIASNEVTDSDVQFNLNEQYDGHSNGNDANEFRDPTAVDRASLEGNMMPPPPPPPPPRTLDFKQPPPAKRQRRSISLQTPTSTKPQCVPIEKCLKFFACVNTWKQWVMTKNAELEQSSVRGKLFKSELLQLTADELNNSLCLFVKEVRKPNGSEYAPDTIHYLMLGIQKFLYENGRIDNIFTDPYYERFTDCLDEVAKKFSVLYSDSKFIVTRIEEEHLWESNQLGVHSPQVLLNTLMFLNTKHFNLKTFEEHMQFSFSNIRKDEKRIPNPGSSKMGGSRIVLSGFHPPKSSHDNFARVRKVYEINEDVESPTRCPVKLYEFYLSKCPESVRTRNDLFYLLPERNCVPDSSIWYSTKAMEKNALLKMFNRLQMVKEINIALLAN